MYIALLCGVIPLSFYRDKTFRPYLCSKEGKGKKKKRKIKIVKKVRKKVIKKAYLSNKKIYKRFRLKVR